MPEGMPYHLETGRTLKLVEDFLNGEDLWNPLARRSRLVDVRDQLGAPNPQPLETLMESWIGSPVQTAMSRLGGRTIAQALRDMWLGHGPNGLYRLNEGKWLNYEGKTEEILRRTFLDAVTLSLEKGSWWSPWPFVLIWKCAQPWLEGWVQWRRRPGVVIIVICTPSDGNHIALDPDLDHAGVSPAPEGFQSPVHTYGSNGSMVLTHDWHSYQAATAMSTTTSQPNTAPLPTFGGVFIGHGPVRAVSPAADDGGVV